MDYVDFVVHIFMPEKREYYGLERLRKSATTMSAADLNAEITKAIAATRKKNPTKPAAPDSADELPATKSAAKKVVDADAPEAKLGGKTGRKTTSKIAIAIAEEAPAKKTPSKKTTAEKSAAKKAAPKPNVTPQPVSRKKPTAKKAAKKSAK